MSKLKPGKWNYGITFDKPYFQLDGKVLRAFCFKASAEDHGMIGILKGFDFEMLIVLPKIRISMPYKFIRIRIKGPIKKKQNAKA